MFESGGWRDLGPMRITNMWVEKLTNNAMNYHLEFAIGESHLEIVSSKRGNAVHVYLNGNELRDVESASTQV